MLLGQKGIQREDRSNDWFGPGLSQKSPPHCHKQQQEQSSEPSHVWLNLTNFSQHFHPSIPQESTSGTKVPLLESAEVQPRRGPTVFSSLQRQQASDKLDKHSKAEWLLPLRQGGR